MKNHKGYFIISAGAMALSLCFFMLQVYRTPIEAVVEYIFCSGMFVILFGNLVSYWTVCFHERSQLEKKNYVVIILFTVLNLLFIFWHGHIMWGEKRSIL